MKTVIYKIVKYYVGCSKWYSTILLGECKLLQLFRRTFCASAQLNLICAYCVGPSPAARFRGVLLLGHKLECMREFMAVSPLVANTINSLEIGLSKKSVMFFPYHGSSSAQLSLTSLETILLDCIVTAVLLACFKKIKIGEFLCSCFNIEDARKFATFKKYYAILFQEREKCN